MKLPSENVMIGIWNVPTLNQCGKLKELTYALDKYIWDIIWLSETHFHKINEVRLPQKKEMASGLTATAEDNNVELASS